MEQVVQMEHQVHQVLQDRVVIHQDLDGDLILVLLLELVQQHLDLIMLHSLVFLRFMLVKHQPPALKQLISLIR